MPEFKLARGERLPGSTHDHRCYATQGHTGHHACYCGTRWGAEGRITVLGPTP